MLSIDDLEIIEKAPAMTKLLGDNISEVQQHLSVLAEDIRLRMKRSALDIYHIGTSLLEAQELLPHGDFLPWIKAEFDMSQRSAYKFISVAKAFRGKFAQNANLEISASALYLLASTDTPQEAREEALELAAAGETISPNKARKIIEKHISVAQETNALGKSMGLPSLGVSVLPESDRTDDLTHTSPFDVDDRFGAATSGTITASVGEILQNPPAHEGTFSKNRKSHEAFTSSNTNEHYTPREIVDAVLECFQGEIELDPCSNSHTSPNIPAIRHFTKNDDGLNQSWKARTVYMNPPYSEIKLWVQKGIQEHSNGQAAEIIFLVKGDTSTKWFQLIWECNPPICFVHHRLCFVNESNNGNSATFASAVVYLGQNEERFRCLFKDRIGVVARRW